MIAHRVPAVFAALIIASLGQALGQDREPTDIRVTTAPCLATIHDSMSSGCVPIARGSGGLLRHRQDVLDQSATLQTTSIEDDNTGILKLDKLQANTRYYYRVEDHQLSGSFRTLPHADDFRNATGNPEGLFNFKFEFACGNDQRGGGDSAGPPSRCSIRSTAGARRDSFCHP